MTQSLRTRSTSAHTPLQVEQLEDRLVMATDIFSGVGAPLTIDAFQTPSQIEVVDSLDVTSSIDQLTLDSSTRDDRAPLVPAQGEIAVPGEVDLFSFTLNESGLLTLSAQGEGFDVRISLRDGQGNLLVQSVEQSALSNDALIRISLPGSFEGEPYQLEVASLDQSVGSYALSSDFAPGALPGVVVLQDVNNPVVTGDFNGDGNADFLEPTGGDFEASREASVESLSLRYGNGDGTFRSSAPIVVENLDSARTFAVADLNNDGRDDLVLGLASPGVITGFNSSEVVQIFLSTGEGAFTSIGQFRPGSPFTDLQIGEYTGDGNVDVITNTGALLAGNGDGTFQTGKQLFSSNEVFEVGLADFNNDGHLDVISDGFTQGITVTLGNGDGSFREESRAPLGFGDAFTVADLDQDGNLDVAISTGDLGLLNSPGRVEVYYGEGDGTFASPLSMEVGPSPTQLVAADFDGDDVLDLAVMQNGFNVRLSLLKGSGGRTFLPPERVEVPFTLPQNTLAASDVNNDGFVDLVADTTLLLNEGDGTFREPIQLEAGGLPNPKIADLNGDGNPDRIIPTELDLGLGGPRGISILLGNGEGSFELDQILETNTGIVEFLVADLNGDGIQDVITVDAVSSGKGGSTFLGKSDGTFEEPLVFFIPGNPNSLAVGDLDQDGVLDLVIGGEEGNSLRVLVGNGDEGGNPLRVLLGNGDGTFQLPETVGAGDALSDLNNDGIADVVTLSTNTNELLVALNRGNGNFDPATIIPVGESPESVTVGDINGDGIPDLFTINAESNDASVLIGDGTGNFLEEQRVPKQFAQITALEDFNGDQRADVITGDGLIFLANGDGTFQQSRDLFVGASPRDVEIADLNNDGALDVITANEGSNNLTVLLGNRDGTFEAPRALATGTAPSNVETSDLNGDGRLDLIVTNMGLPDQIFSTVSSDTVSVLLGNGDGTFQEQRQFEVGASPISIQIDDLNQDGIRDLVIYNQGRTRILPGLFLTFDPAGTSTLLGKGDGTFQPLQFQELEDGYPVEDRFAPSSSATGDLNNDGRDDLVIADADTNTIAVLLDNGEGEDTPLEANFLTIRSVPLVVRGGDNQPNDVANLNRAGEILLRPGGTQSSPIILNSGRPVQDLALTERNGLSAIAALDSQTGQVVFFVRQEDGSYLTEEGPSVPATLANRMVVGDLNQDGLDDLVITSNSNEALIYLQNRDTGTFNDVPDFRRVLGTAPSDILLVDLNEDGFRDIVTSNFVSGDLSVILNLEGTNFSTQQRFRAGTGLVEVDSETGIVDSREGVLSVVAGDFDGIDGVDLVALSKGSNRFSFLQGTGTGAVLNPVSGFDFLTGVNPVMVVTGDFNDDANLDLAILNEFTRDVSIFLGEDEGGFTQQFARDSEGNPVTLNVGNDPSGLSVADVDGDGIQDLLVGNQAGDVLTVLGNGDGTFRPFTRSSNTTPLVVTDLDQDGQADDAIVVVGSTDRVIAQIRGEGTEFTAGNLSFDRTDGLIGPEAAQLADVDGRNGEDLIVANSGSNNVLVFLRQEDGSFGEAQSFFTGTNPIGLTLADFNNDAILDLAVTNRGSNDVTVLLGDSSGTDWTFLAGPRLDTGLGPIAVEASDQTGDDIVDLIVTNGQEGTVTLLEGVGNGLFNDVNPQVLVGFNAPIPGVIPGFIITPEGSLVTTSPLGSADAFSTVFTAVPQQAVTFVRAFNRGNSAAPDLFVGRSDGSVARLTFADDAFSVDPNNIFTSTDLLDPSGLELVAGENSLELYVTGAGSELPLVFEIDLSNDNSNPGDDQSPGVGIDVANPGDLTLGVVATLSIVPGGGDAFVSPQNVDRLLESLLQGINVESLSEMEGETDEDSDADFEASPFVIGLGEDGTGEDDQSDSSADPEMLEVLLTVLENLEDGWTDLVDTTDSSSERLYGLLDQIAEALKGSAEVTSGTLPLNDLRKMELPTTGIRGTIQQMRQSIVEQFRSVVREFVSAKSQPDRTDATPDTEPNVVQKTVQKEANAVTVEKLNRTWTPAPLLEMRNRELASGK